MTSGGALFVVLASPETMLAPLAAGFAAFLGHGATRTVGACQGLAAITAAVALSRRGEEDMGLASAHCCGMPGRWPQIDRCLESALGGIKVNHIAHYERFSTKRCS